ncbi:MAG: peptidoglycan-binding protein [Patescibacteria group bacterium]|nr:peptidoglycan-binding protein [Patescibacteria group bacterium]
MGADCVAVSHSLCPAGIACVSGTAQDTEATSGGPVPSAPQTACPLNQHLALGMSGAQVSCLQTLLARFPSIYPQGLVTGYFGPLTLAAVERYQAQYNIVASGSPSTTVFGAVGPRTRKFLLVQ